MLKIERQKIIEDELLKNGFILVPEMGEKLSCSESLCGLCAQEVSPGKCAGNGDSLKSSLPGL